MARSADIIEGNYLSSEGVARIKEIYKANRRSDYKFLKLYRDRYQSTLLANEWGSFDQLYCSIYFMNICGFKIISMPEKVVQSLDGLPKRGSLTVIFDVSLPEIDDETPFEDTLLSEVEVVNFVRLRKSIESLVPYRTRVSTVGLGCLWMEFSIYAKPSVEESKSKHLIGLTSELIKNSPGWSRLKRRFGLNEEKLGFKPV